MPICSHLNCLYSRFDKFDFSVQQGEVMNAIQENLKENANIHVSERKVRNLFKKLNSHKTHGPDFITSKMLKVCADQLAGPFRTLFQASIDNTCVPALWKKIYDCTCS